MCESVLKATQKNNVFNIIRGSFIIEWMVPQFLRQTDRGNQAQNDITDIESNVT